MIKLKKNKKLYVARYVPYASKVRSQKLLMLKSSALTLIVMFFVISASFIAAKSIPKEIEEAAMIDGCGPIRTFFLVVFPLMKPPRRPSWATARRGSRTASTA